MNHEEMNLFYQIDKLRQKYETNELNALEQHERNKIIDNEVGWIHNLRAHPLYLSLHHKSALAMVRKWAAKTAIAIHLDDISNLTSTVDGNRLLHSCLWVRDPSGEAPLQIAEFISRDWSANLFGQQFGVFMQELDPNENANFPVFVMDNYAGFIKYVIKVRNGCNVHEYYELCLEFFKKKTTDLPKTLVARCGSHTSKDLTMWFGKKNAPQSKAVVKGAWDTLKKTLCYQHWVEIVSLLRFLQYTNKISVSGDCIPIYDPFVNVTYNLEEVYQESKNNFENATSPKTKDDQIDGNDDSYEDPGIEHFKTDETKLLFPVKGSSNVYMALNTDSRTVSIGFGFSAVQVMFEWIDDTEEFFKIVLDETNVFEYPFKHHFKWVGSYCALIFGEFGDNVTNNGRAEKGNAQKRVCSICLSYAFNNREKRWTLRKRM